MTPVSRRRLLVALAVALAFVLTAGAQGAIVTSHDDAGRQITFDVRAPNVDTEWYASVLRAAAHGNEISAVTIRIVPEPQIPALCGGQDAAACYTGRTGAPLIVVPAGKSTLLESVLLHEYGHHISPGAARGGVSPRHVLARVGCARAERHLYLVDDARDGISPGAARGGV